ncbi:MAG TPA: amidase [Solirubrobacteraceae bacterium]|jgi:amidase|nr:amidase [Solirubrobacteraceae bacterium]
MASATANLLTRPASELAGLVRAGEVAARELIEATLERVEALNQGVNAFTALDGERALASAELVGAGDERPFAGVPIAIKDLFTPMKDFRQTNCSALLAGGAPATFDHNVVSRIKAAGFVIVGTTNSPEFGILPVTEPRLNGPTRNPWDPERTPGGSSGGAAAAVASGMVPLAQGSDGGGSLRTPASCCGLFALKPSRGRISMAPALGESYLATPGVLTRTVADSAALLDILGGYEPGDASWAPEPGQSFLAACARDPGRLRVGLYTGSPLGSEIDPLCIQAAKEAAELLCTLGHEIVETPLLDMHELMPMFTAMWAVHIAGAIALTAMLAGTAPSEEHVEPLSWALFQQGAATSALELMAITVRLQAVSRQLVAMFADFDVLLTPSLGQRPVRIGEIDACSQEPMADFEASARFAPYGAIWNVTGQPAMTVPLYDGADGLPLTVQIVGRPAEEATLLSLAGQLEAACPWAQRLAPSPVSSEQQPPALRQAQPKQQTTTPPTP